jgi:hypothetical protein
VTRVWPEGRSLSCASTTTCCSSGCWNTRIDQPAFDTTTFSKNRLLDHEIPGEFFAAVVIKSMVSWSARDMRRSFVRFI